LATPAIPEVASLMQRAPVINARDSIVIVANQASDIFQSNTLARERPSLLRFLPGGVPAELAERGALREAHATWMKPEFATTDPIPTDQCRDEMAEVLRLYRSLMTWCLANRRAPNVLAALDSLSRLGQALGETDPDTVVDIFARVEPVLKYNGDFNLMFRFGLIAESACKKAPARDRRIIELQTQATTCAHAWVLQRTGRLREAEHQLDLDETLNRDAGVNRGLAFTLKCRGRLRRIIADRSDRSPTEEARNKFLGLSLADLREARDVFQRLDSADRQIQVADTDSLIARTYLALGDLKRARRMWRRADLLARSKENKTYLDQRILDDEIKAAERREAGEEELSATPGIDEVLFLTEHDAAVAASEIRARALFARARLHAAADLDYTDDVAASVAIYEALSDLNSASEVKWWAILTGPGVGEQTRRMLEDHPPSVRMRAYESYVDELGLPTLTAIAHRERDEHDRTWQRHIRQARQADAIEEGHPW